jgi:hypothetical protein
MPGKNVILWLEVVRYVYALFVFGMARFFGAVEPSVSSRSGRRISNAAGQIDLKISAKTRYSACYQLLPVTPFSWHSLTPPDTSYPPKT